MNNDNEPPVVDIRESDTDKPVAGPASQKTPSKLRSWLAGHKKLVGVLGALLIVIIVALVLFVIFADKDKKPTDSAKVNTQITSDDELRATVDTINSVVDQENESLKSLDGYLEEN
jgi:hypothetical protein